MTMLFFAFLEYANMTFPARQRLAASVRLALARGLSTTCGTVQRGIVSPAFSTRVWYAPEMAVTSRAPAEETTHCPPSKNAPPSPQPQATTLPSFLRARLWNLPAAIAGHAGRRSCGVSALLLHYGTSHVTIHSSI